MVALINERYKVGDELKRSIRDDIVRLIDAKTYRCGAAAAGAAAATFGSALLHHTTNSNSSQQQRLHAALFNEVPTACCCAADAVVVRANRCSVQHQCRLRTLHSNACLLCGYACIAGLLHALAAVCACFMVPQATAIHLCYCLMSCRGKRHSLGLPVRGQKTGCNAQTSRKFKRHIMYDVK